MEKDSLYADCTMGKQYSKVLKRRRRKARVERKKAIIRGLKK
jgi:hypothetical protein